VSGYVTSNRLAKLRSELADRDWQIISTLVCMRLATSAQLEALHFAGVTRRRAQQRLTALVERRVIGRPTRVVGGVRAGSRGHVYALDVAGQRLADLDRDRRPRPPRPVGRRYVDHALAVTEVYVRLVLAERAGALRLQHFAGEPESWRSFYGPGGARARLNPDAYAALEVNGYEDHWFFEVDLGTEHAPALARKCAVYRAYWQSGAEEAHGGVFPRVLWVVPDERRAQMLRQVFRRQPEEAAELFDVALTQAVVERVLQGAAP
jgi:hypothetical protein